MDESRLAVDDAAQLLERLMTVVRARLRDRASTRSACAADRAGGWKRGNSSSMSSRAYQTSSIDRPAKSRIASRYARDRALHDAPAPLLRELVLAARDLEARGQPLHVPFPRTGRRLVEVVDVEEQVTLRRAEDPEVREMRIAADLDVQPRVRGRGQIGGHRQRRAPEVGERRDQHAPVANGHELRHPGPGLLLEQVDRVHAVREHPPVGVARARDGRSGRLSACGTLFERNALPVGLHESGWFSSMKLPNGSCRKAWRPAPAM